MEATSGSTAGLREELRNDARMVRTTAKQRLHNEVDARKGQAANQAKTLSSALGAAANELSDGPPWIRSAFEQGAQRVQSLADAVEHKDSRQLAQDVQRFARENTALFLAGCAIAGFAAARIFKVAAADGSTADSADTARDQRVQPDDVQTPATTFYGGSVPETPAAPDAMI